MTTEPSPTPTVTIKEDGGESDIGEKEIRVGIDKIKIRVDFTSSKAPEYIQIQEWARSVRGHEFGNKHKVWSKPGRSQTSVAQELDGGGTLFILYGRHRGGFRAWFEFNPNKVVIAELEGHLSTMLNSGMYSLVERGVVTYCEFAIDVPNTQIEDYVFLSRTHRQQDLGWVDKGGIYIGSRRHGELYFHVYDKQRQLREAEKTVVEHPWLRIEARISGKRRFPLRSILELPTPFSSLLVQRRSCVEQALEVDLLSDIASAQGIAHEVQYRLSCLDGQQKKHLIDRLSHFQVEWWAPELLWERLAASLGWMSEGMFYSGWA